MKAASFEIMYNFTGMIVFQHQSIKASGVGYNSH